jgi:methionine sulfoxide reductase heme-binding subunit
MKKSTTYIQIICHALCLLPLALLIFGTISNQLTANPIRETTIRTGRIAIITLLISLSCTSVNSLLKMDSFLSIRKELGLYAGFYAGMHFLNFAGRDYQFDWNEILKVIQIQVFIQLGLAAFALLLILMIFSFPLLQNKLKNIWERIRWITYLLTGFALLHNFLAVKGDKSLPIFYIFWYVTLLISRLDFIKGFQFKIPFLIHINQLLKTSPGLHG